MAKKKSNATKSAAKNSVDKKNPDSLDVVRKAVEKKYGPVVTIMGEIRNRKFPTVSTGSIGLDLALGKVLKRCVRWTLTVGDAYRPQNQS